MSLQLFSILTYYINTIDLKSHTLKKKSELQQLDFISVKTTNIEMQI